MAARIADRLDPDTPSSLHKKTRAQKAQPPLHKLWSDLQEVCDLLKVPIVALSQHANLAFQHMQFHAGQGVHRIGQPFEHLFVVNSGFLKTALLGENGEEQVLSFPMRGDLLGIDAIYSRRHTSEAIALSDCDLILIPFKAFSQLGKTYPELELAIYSVMSRELVREQAMVAMLGSLSAEARIARFLVTQAQRHASLGYSSTQFNLRMTRRDIGNYLGLSLETVSRTFSAFHAMGLIKVDQRMVDLVDVQALKTLRRMPPSMLRARDSRPGIKLMQASEPKDIPGK